MTGFTPGIDTPGFDQALEAAKRGESIIAVKRDKRPWYSWKRYQETPATPAEIRAWASNSLCAGFAVVTGAVSGLVILDFDGEDGIALCDRLGLDPHVQTPRGGFHVRFHHPGVRVKTLNSEASRRLQEHWHGLDPKGDGGYAVEWGSSENGCYQALRDLTDWEDLSRLPEQLLVDIGIKNGTPSSTAHSGTRGKVHHPGRHAHLLGIAGAMRGRGEDAAAILAELRRVNARDCEPPKPDAKVVSLAEDVVSRYPPGPTEVQIEHYKVTFTDDKRPQLVLPDVPPHTDLGGLAAWVTSVLRLDPHHPATGAAHEGLRGPEGHVVIRRAEAPDLRFEPARIMSTSRTLRAALIWQLLPSDGEPYGFADKHASRIAVVVRRLCGACAAPSEAAETTAIIGSFLSAAVAVEGFTTYGETGQRYEALDALRPPTDPRTGRLTGPPRYLIDKNTGEVVIRPGDLQDAARRHIGSSLPHGWLDARVENLGWDRVTLQGYQLSGRDGRRGPHLRSGVYRGLLASDDPDDAER